MKTNKPFLVFLMFLLVCGSTAMAQATSALSDSFVYRKVGDISLKAYVFKPVKNGKAHPAILLFHGGA